MRIAALSVRTRLTLWHAGALTLIVCVFAVGVLLFVTGVFFTSYTSNSNARIQLDTPDHLRAELYGRATEFRLVPHPRVRAIIEMRIENPNRQASHVDLRFQKTRQRRRYRIRLLGREPGDDVIAPVENREPAQQSNTELAWRILRVRSGELVDASETNLHFQLLAEYGRLIDKTAARGPMHIYFL